MPEKVQIPIEVLKKTKEEWTKAIEQDREKSGGCAICDFVGKQTGHQYVNHDGACRYCPLHPKICCDYKGNHKRLPLYWRYRSAYAEQSPDLTKLAKECVAVLDQMIAKLS